MERRRTLAVLLGASLLASAALGRPSARPGVPSPAASPPSHPAPLPAGSDAPLQQAAERLLERARAIRGGAVVVDVKTGQVLAVVQSGAGGTELLTEPVAPAASVFKLVTTAALYEHGRVQPGERVCTRGGLRSIEAEHLLRPSGPGTNCLPFQEALGVSRNAAFAQLAVERLARKDLLDIAEGLGFNRPLALDHGGRMGALKVPYNDLDFARTAAGFENSQLSIFGGAQLALAIASGGLSRAMHLRGTPDETETERRILSALTAQRLRRAMEITVQSGTAHEAFMTPEGRQYLGYLQVAGKTGTLKPARGGPTSSWFIGFAPSNKPKIVVSVLLQIEDAWHEKAPSLARDLFRAYFAERGAKNVTPPLR
jgi:penicillin-binding protein A